MVFVDTSIWIDFFKGKKIIVEQINNLLDEEKISLPILVRLEILAGARKEDTIKLKRVFSALPCLYPSQEIWNMCEERMIIARGKGETFGVVDLLIATLCQAHQHQLWSFDTDFLRMAKLGFVDLYKYKH